MATPIGRRDETGSEGSRESSTSGDSKTAKKSLLNSSLISAQSDVVLRRPRDGHTSPYVSTPVLSRHGEADATRLRSATHDVSAFRARQVRSEIFNDSDWSPGRLGRPRSMDALDKLPSSSSTLTPGDAGSGDGHVSEDDVGGTLPRTKQQGMLKHLSPAASPRGLRKPRWAQSSPNISPMATRKEYPIAVGPLPPSPPSPTSSRRSASPRSSPILARKLEDRPTTRSPKHSPILSRKENTNTQGGPRRSILQNQYNQSLDTVPIRERSTEPSIPKVSVQVVSSSIAPDASVAQPPSSVPASPFQEDHVKRINIESVESSPQTLRFNGDVSSISLPYHEREHSGERREKPTTSSPRGFQRQRSFSGERNIQPTEASRNNIHHLRNRSSSGNKNDAPRAIQSTQSKEGSNRDTGQTGPAHSRERSLSDDRNSGLRVVQTVKNGPSRDTAQLGPAHSRSLSADRNDGLRASQRQGTIFAASSIPRQSVPVTAHYVTTGTVAKSEPIPAVTSGVGTSVYIDAAGVNLCSTPANRAEGTTSPVYAVVRDKDGDERVIPVSKNTPSSRDFSTTSRDQPSLSRANAAMSNTTPTYSSPASRNTVSSDTSSTSRYSTSSLSRNSVVSNPVELKPFSSEQRDENRNDPQLQVTAAGVHEASKQNVSSVRARILEIEHHSPPRASQAVLDDDDDDARSVSSQHSRDCSPALRKVRSKARKAAKEKEILIDSPASSEADSNASGRKSAAEERSRTRSAVGAKEGEGKKSSVWYEYGCV